MPKVRLSPTALTAAHPWALAGFGAGARVDSAALVAKGIVRARGGPVKVLGDGDAPRNLTLAVSAVSASAREKTEAAGGRIEFVA